MATEPPSASAEQLAELLGLLRIVQKRDAPPVCPQISPPPETGKNVVLNIMPFTWTFSDALFKLCPFLLDSLDQVDLDPEEQAFLRAELQRMSEKGQFLEETGSETDFSLPILGEGETSLAEARNSRRNSALFRLLEKIVPLIKRREDPWARIAVDVSKSTVSLDGVDYTVSEHAARLTKVLVEAEGDWLSRNKIIAKDSKLPVRVDRIKFPPLLDALIDSVPGKGYRFLISKLA